jgi:hypothetical protein
MARMTNDPNRKRDDDEPAAGTPGTAGISPAGVAAHTSNGVPPGLKPDPVILAAKAVAQALGEHLPDMLFQAMAAALSQVALTAQRPPCATCIIERIRWENANRDAMQKAMGAAAEAAGIEPVTPQASQLDLTAFLPPRLHPGKPGGMPGVSQSITAYQGTETCAPHLAQAAGVQPGRSPLLIATAAMSPAMAGQFAGNR